MAGITIGGIGSGLDINGIVAQLVAAERQPVVGRLNRQESALKAQLSAIGTFKSALSNFQTAAGALTNQDAFQAMKATVGDESLFTATASSSATAGSYQIKVNQLAQSQKLASGTYASADDTVATGTLTIRFGSYNGSDDAGNTSFTENPDKASKSIEIDASNNTLAGVRDAINKADIGVRASIVNDGSGYRLVVSSAATGANNALEITGIDEFTYSAATKNMTQTLAAQNAALEVDGLAVTSAGNTLTEVVPGVTLTLKSASATATTLDVAADKSVGIASAEAFVDAYNKLFSTIKSLTSFDPDTKTQGTLLGDSTVRSVTGQLRGILGQAIGDDTNALRTLADLGISTQRDGTLSLDKSKFESVLADNPAGVAAVFTQGTDTTAPKGIADKLDDFLTEVLKSGGSLDFRTTSLNGRLSGIGDQRDALARRMEAVEARYIAQFTAMDKLVSQLTATSNFLTQQLAGLANIYKTD